MKSMSMKALFGAAILAGVVSSAMAQPHTVYLTGSTAYRSVDYTSLRHERGNSGGSVFDGAGTNGARASPTVLSGSDSSGANAIVYDGWLNGVEYIINCSFFFFSSRRRHTRSLCDWSSDVCSSD